MFDSGDWQRKENRLRHRYEKQSLQGRLALAVVTDVIGVVDVVVVGGGGGGGGAAAAAAAAGISFGCTSQNSFYLLR